MKSVYSSLNSSAIASLVYENDFGMLEVLFHHGNRYTYIGVPKELYLQMTDGRSVGEYYNQQIKGQFPVYEGGFEELVDAMKPFVGAAFDKPAAAPQPFEATAQLLVIKELETTIQRLNQQVGVVNAIRKLESSDPEVIKPLWSFYDYLESQK